VSISVAVNMPRTPVTEGSGDKAAATLPNVCKMPGPPAPFVPTPLPNVGGSSDRLKKGTTTVKIEGKKVAIKGAYYMSMPSGDAASQGTGGGILSATVQGKTEFTAPGSMNVKAEGKNIQLLGDAMTNNGSSKNTGATIPGNFQASKAEQEIADYMCKALCDAIRDKIDSNELEKKLAKSRILKKHGVSFRTFADVKVLQSTAKTYLRSVQKAIGALYGTVRIKPDAIMGAAVEATKGVMSRIVGPGQRCFEIKLPGDRVGRGMQSADQLDRQAQLCEGRRPIKIACQEDGGVCTDCPHCATAAR
jgi:uncharacterized Zn-binding protein involved in type VI secretion